MAGLKLLVLAVVAAVCEAQLGGIFRGIEFASNSRNSRNSRSNSLGNNPSYRGPYRPQSMPSLSVRQAYTGGYRTTGTSSATPQRTAPRIVPVQHSPGGRTVKMSSSSTSSVSKEIEKPVMRQVHVSGPTRVQISTESTTDKNTDPRSIQVVSLSRNNDNYLSDPWERELNNLDREMASFGGFFGGGWGGLFGLGGFGGLGGLGGGLGGAGLGGIGSALGGPADPVGAGVGAGRLGGALGGGLRGGLGWDARSDFIGDRWDARSDLVDGRFDARSDMVDGRFDYLSDRADSYGDYASDIYDTMADRYDYS